MAIVPTAEATTDRVTRADTDRELVRRMAAGDTSSVGEFYDRWAPLVHSLVLRLVGDPGEAEDVVEETFWQAWRQAARYDESRGAVSTWIITVGRSRALDRVRARRRDREDPWSQLPELDLESLGGSTEGSAGDPQRSAEQSERRTLVAAALGTLPAEQRETILLAYFGGLSQSEIADRMGMPLGTVKTRTRLAMEKLRDQLSVLREGAAWTP
ncbi:MAG: sigma-70 family RNA polymerase sigma factor [Gemmatimonadota bacterium]|nr:sigma-70 family RNA polymerase sigma factor [Gemmatimonadota bacterium]